jgi:tetratricopeptide (TPR) repeat protein
MGEGDERTFNFEVGDELLPRPLLAENERLPGEVLESDGLDLIQSSPEFATSLLLVNTVLYPDSANTWDSVGYAYRQTGDTTKAIEYYREALKRDPEFASAKQALEELLP